MHVCTQTWCTQRNPCFAAVRVRNESYQPHQTTVSKAMFQYFACSGSHMVCYISSLKSPPCILLSSILRHFPLCDVKVKRRAFTSRLYPPGPSPQQLWLIKRILSTAGGKDLLSAPSRLSNPQLLSCPWGANVQLPNANSVRSYRHYFPSEKCQMDGDFLLYDFTGMVTVQCRRDSVLVW